MKSVKTDILVIGGGVIGSSVAMQLSRLGAQSVRVVDFDLEGSLSSSELNAGGVRATWNQPINIQMAKTSIEYFAQAEVARDVGYRDCGYLWLQTPGGMPQALRARELQQKMGWEVEALDVAELRRRVPFIDKTDDLAGAIFGKRDGLVNPNLLKNHYRRKARECGVVFDDRIWVSSARMPVSSPAGAVSPIRIFADSYPRVFSNEFKVQVLSGQSPERDAEPVEYEAGLVVNCAGPWAAKISGILGYRTPSKPIRRQVSIFDCRDVDLTPYGMIVDPSGVYFHPEASNGLAGFATRDEPAGVNYAYDGESFFTETIWPALYERSSKFERLKHLTGWAGLYEVSPDESAIIGAAPGHERVFECHSFSGHGVMHSFAAGLAVAEQILGKPWSIDVTPLSGGRFETGALVRETQVI